MIANVAQNFKTCVENLREKEPIYSTSLAKIVEGRVLTIRIKKLKFEETTPIEIPILEYSKIKECLRTRPELRKDKNKPCDKALRKLSLNAIAGPSSSGPPKPSSKPKIVKPPKKQDHVKERAEPKPGPSRVLSEDEQLILPPPPNKAPRLKTTSRKVDKIKTPPEVVERLDTPARTTSIDSSVDQLVFNEPEDDEFAKYKYDDEDKEEETLLSKNLKKIRYTQAPKPPVAPKPTNPITQLRQYINPVKPANPPVNPPANPPAPPPQQTNPDKSVKENLPNWIETNEQLKNNNFNIVFKDLSFHKSKISQNDQAKNLLKELVLKSIQEDETFLLADSLNLIFDLALHYDDVKFWSELVGRLHRKLTGFNKYKSKTDPKTIYDNFRRTMDILSDRAKLANLRFELATSMMSFLLNPNTVIKAPTTMKKEGESPSGLSKPITGVKTEPTTKFVDVTPRVVKIEEVADGKEVLNIKITQPKLEPSNTSECQRVFHRRF